MARGRGRPSMRSGQRLGEVGGGSKRRTIYPIRISITTTTMRRMMARGSDPTRDTTALGLDRESTKNLQLQQRWLSGGTVQPTRRLRTDETSRRDIQRSIDEEYDGVEMCSHDEHGCLTRHSTLTPGRQALSVTAKSDDSLFKTPSTIRHAQIHMTIRPQSRIHPLTKPYALSPAPTRTVLQDGEPLAFLPTSARFPALASTLRGCDSVVMREHKDASRCLAV